MINYLELDFIHWRWSAYLYNGHIMNIFFVVSACLWSWLVGRSIAFGPKCSVIMWRPEITPDSWYSLTKIPAKIPPMLIVYMPFVFTILSIPTPPRRNNYFNTQYHGSHATLRTELRAYFCHKDIQ